MPIFTGAVKVTHETGFTLVEVMLAMGIIALLAAIAIPNVLRGRTTANESAVIANVRALSSALEMYRAVNNQYPWPWQGEMYTNADPDYGPPAFNGNMFGSLVQGYSYVYGRGTPQTFILLAQPLNLGRDGIRTFFTDQTGIIRHCRGRVGAGMADDNTLDAAPRACD